GTIALTVIGAQCDLGTSSCVRALRHVRLRLACLSQSSVHIVKHTIIFLAGCAATSGAVLTYYTFTAPSPSVLPRYADHHLQQWSVTYSSEAPPTTPVSTSPPAVTAPALPMNQSPPTWPPAKDVLTPIGPRRFELKRSF